MISSNILISHNLKMEESTRDELDHDEAENIIAKVQKFMQDGCGCRRGLKHGQCSYQITEETILNNVYNHLELSYAELDLVILANIQAFTAIEVTGEKEKEVHLTAFFISLSPSARRCFSTSMESANHGFSGL